ncbi:MAG: OmpA-like protein, partial [Pseudomonadota bacterium]|nr:OmpA-like protein [Pseudomonadota bacterium]
MQPIQSPEKLDEIPVFQTKVDPLRLELLHQLWKIKQGLERLSGQPVHLTQLRKDAGYLQTMLKEAEDAADPEMQQAVARIRDLLAQGVVLDQEFHLDDAPSLLIKPEVNPIPASGARSRW